MHAPYSLRATQQLLNLYEDGEGSGDRSSLADTGYLSDDVDFSDFNTCIRLAAQGIFSVDRADHRAQREQEAAEQDLLNAAYLAVGVDRQQAYKCIASRIEAVSFNGVWARSTGKYGAAVAALDRLVTIRAAQVLATPQAANDIAVNGYGSITVFTLNSAAAHEWVGINLSVEGWQWLSRRSFGVEPRLGDQLIRYAVADGLEVAA